MSLGIKVVLNDFHAGIQKCKIQQLSLMVSWAIAYLV